MATHSSILAWKISWTEESGWLQSMRSQSVGHDWATNTTTTKSFNINWSIYQKLYTYQNLYTYFSNFIWNRQKVKTVKISINKWINRVWSSYTIQLSHSKEWTINTYNNINESNYASEIYYILYDSVWGNSVKCTLCLETKQISKYQRTVHRDRKQEEQIAKG